MMLWELLAIIWFASVGAGLVVATILDILDDD